ncbi:MAG: efflux RND transporter periplasmic adaptor subunit [Xanthobacteraceae bacterium]|nr:efflux RND transporter periplasmic adaptor subunit [Xanthobacteraceae bacterium]
MNERPHLVSITTAERVMPEDRVAEPVARRRTKGRPGHGWLLAAGAAILLGGGLGFGASHDYAQREQVAATAQQQRDFVPSVMVGDVKPSGETVDVSLPGTTFAFEAANIFARTNGYIVKRNVDIGSRVKAGDVLAELTAPELDHQIAQAQATLAQAKAALRQNQASRKLAQVTNDRVGTLVKQGWATAQLGDTDRLSLEAQEAAVGVAEANIAAQENLIKVLAQQKSYQRVVAPFDGVITQRAVDVGSLVQAGGTFMFTLMHSHIIRVQVFVPQDQAFGLAPGVKAVVRVPEMPDRAFAGEVTRIAEALQQGTRTLLTEIDVPNPDGTLSPGIYCTVELHIPRKVPSLIVPANAIVFNKGGLQIAVVEDGIVHLRKITVARDFGTHLEVRDGVKAGDQVVLNPTVDLAEGRRVTTRTPAT